MVITAVRELLQNCSYVIWDTLPARTSNCLCSDYKLEAWIKALASDIICEWLFDKSAADNSVNTWLNRLLCRHLTAPRDSLFSFCLLSQTLLCQFVPFSANLSSLYRACDGHTSSLKHLILSPSHYQVWVAKKSIHISEAQWKEIWNSKAYKGISAL